MYTIKRTKQNVLVTEGAENIILNAPKDGFILYEKPDGREVASRISSLNDEELLVALANRIVIPTGTE